MRISINLATRPFVELRPLFARLRLVMLTLVLLGVGLVFGAHRLSERARVATEEMDALRAKTTAFEQERLANEARMRQPENRGVLERSQFLNALFASKSFSWTAVMMDLERVLPQGIQVTSIEPVIAKEGDVSIRLRVSGDRDRAIQLVRNLERAPRFLSPRVASEASLTKEKAAALGGAVAVSLPGGGTDVAGNGVEFEIFSGYNPLPLERVSVQKAEQTEEPVAAEEAGSAGGVGGAGGAAAGVRHDRRAHGKTGKTPGSAR